MVNFIQICLIFLSFFVSFASKVFAENNENYHPFVKVGNKYYFINGELKMNWFESSEYCRSLRGDLANIESLDELLVLEKYILTRGILSQLWFDGNDLANEGRYMSHSTGRPILFTKWYSTNPDNQNDEDCLEVCIDDKTLLMNDHHCEREFYAICQLRESIMHCSGKNSLILQDENCIVKNLVESLIQAADAFKSHSQPLLCPTS
uniref:Macrophage mannose receptor 1 n=1 Tax=Bactrocera latifrons TaxID=174628 RepID=A0A0K8VBC2_BACLA